MERLTTGSENDTHANVTMHDERNAGKGPSKHMTKNMAANATGTSVGARHYRVEASPISTAIHVLLTASIRITPVNSPPRIMPPVPLLVILDLRQCVNLAMKL